MRTQTKILAISAAVMLAAFALIRSGSEPTYEQISLTEWLDYYAATASLDEGAINLRLDRSDFTPPEPTQAKEAAQAIRQMGPQVLPYLLKWIKTRSAPPAGHEAERCLYRAFTGFLILGNNASAAIPELAKVAADPTAPGCPFAIRALVEIGPSGVPALTNALLHPLKEATKERILRGLKEIPPGQIVAIPILVEALKHPDGPIARDAAELLGKIGEQPEIVVPPLIAALHRNEYYVRIAAAGALAHYGEHASPAVPLLLSALRNEAERTRQYFIDALRQIAPESLTNSTRQ